MENKENKIATLVEKKDLQAFTQRFAKNGFLIYAQSDTSDLVQILECNPKIIDDKKYDMILSEGTDDKIKEIKKQGIDILSNDDFVEHFNKTNRFFISMNENEKEELQKRADEFGMNIASLLYFATSNIKELKNSDKLLDKLNKNKKGKKVGLLFRMTLKDKGKFTEQASSYGLTLGDYLIICGLNFKIELKFNKKR